ncbi:MAG: YibE/F family protein, partial [Streptomyces sp.]|nr:YibE/F family protein [Streptomyces sp.]
GSIGLVASVPVTTLLAALVVAADRPDTRTQTATTGTVAVGGTAARTGRGHRRKR